MITTAEWIWLEDLSWHMQWNAFLLLYTIVISTQILNTTRCVFRATLQRSSDSWNWDFKRLETAGQSLWTMLAQDCGLDIIDLCLSFLLYLSSLFHPLLKYIEIKGKQFAKYWKTNNNNSDDCHINRWKGHMISQTFRNKFLSVKATILFTLKKTLPHSTGRVKGRKYRVLLLSVIFSSGA